VFAKYPALSTAESEVAFGSEVEFPSVSAFEEHYVKAARRRCDVCAEVFECKFRTNDRRGTMIEVSEKNTTNSLQIFPTEDISVVEIRTNPMSYMRTLKNARIIHVFIFGVGEDLKADKLIKSSLIEPNRWSGHVNVSWPDLVWEGTTQDPMIKERLRYLLRFYVDYQNHPELAMGVLGGDIRNASPLAIFPETNRKILQSLISDFELGVTKDVTQILHQLIDNQCAPGKVLVQYLEEPRYSVINLHPLLKALGANKGFSRRLELRAFYTPTSVEQMLSQYRIVQSRLDYLRKFSGPIVYFNRELKYPERFLASGLQGDVTHKEAAQTFIKYLSEAGLDPVYEAQFLTNQIVASEVRRQSRP
jgi:hypothetical protein